MGGSQQSRGHRRARPRATEGELVSGSANAWRCKACLEDARTAGTKLVPPVRKTRSMSFAAMLLLTSSPSTQCSMDSRSSAIHVSNSSRVTTEWMFMLPSRKLNAADSSCDSATFSRCTAWCSLIAAGPSSIRLISASIFSGSSAFGACAPQNIAYVARLQEREMVPAFKICVDPRRNSGQ